MRTKSIILYEARIILGMATLIPLLLLPVYLLLGWFIWKTRGAVPEPAAIAASFEMLLPLGAGLSCAHLMSLEREENFDLLRRSYPERSWRVPVMRVLLAVGGLMLSALIAATLYYLIDGAYAVEDVVLPALAPALYLAGMALCINNITGNYWVAAGIIILYWYFDFATGGYYMRFLYLFNHTMPYADIDPALNRGLLMLAAMGFFSLNIAVSVWRRRRGA